MLTPLYLFLWENIKKILLKDRQFDYVLIKLHVKLISTLLLHKQADLIVSCDFVMDCILIDFNEISHLLM